MVTGVNLQRIPILFANGYGAGAASAPIFSGLPEATESLWVNRGPQPRDRFQT